MSSSRNAQAPALDNNHWGLTRADASRPYHYCSSALCCLQDLRPDLGLWQAHQLRCDLDLILDVPG
ncbi:hypothetical protein [Microvirga sp. VF16]|uniref:hypothetical protein n=1 Tax=Microvirga sp. VF16 TaxID=2807101 RepID=UPI00193CC804|nr:hypothetical protein JO965_36600 [Microvirga sp. VF16]